MLTNFMLLQMGTEGGSQLMMWMPIIVIFVIMYFLILRPQIKKQKDHQKMQESLQKGDRVITGGGIYGTIVGVKEKENSLIVEIADKVKVEVARSSVGRKIEKTES